LDVGVSAKLMGFRVQLDPTRRDEARRLSSVVLHAAPVAHIARKVCTINGPVTCSKARLGPAAFVLGAGVRFR
jgi:hypothetical protein